MDGLAGTLQRGGSYFERDENTPRKAVSVLGDLADQRAISPLVGALQDESECVRTAAVDALARLKALDQLIDALQVADLAVRRAAAEALGKLGDLRAAPTLLATLSDDDLRVRIASAKALAKLDRPLTNPLIRVLQAADNKARRAAAEALGKLGDSEAVLPLVNALRDRAIGRIQLRSGQPYIYSHLVILLGIVVLGAGIGRAIADTQQAPLSFQTFALLWAGFGAWFLGSFLLHLVAPYPEGALDFRSLLGYHALIAVAALVITLSLFPLLRPLSGVAVLLAFIIIYLTFDTHRHRRYGASQANLATNEG